MVKRAEQLHEHEAAHHHDHEHDYEKARNLLNKVAVEAENT